MREDPCVPERWLGILPIRLRRGEEQFPEATEVGGVSAWPWLRAEGRVRASRWRSETLSGA